MKKKMWGLHAYAYTYSDAYSVTTIIYSMPFSRTKWFQILPKMRSIKLWMRFNNVLLSVTD